MHNVMIKSMNCTFKILFMLFTRLSVSLMGPINQIRTANGPLEGKTLATKIFHFFLFFKREISYLSYQSRILKHI